MTGTAVGVATREAGARALNKTGNSAAAQRQQLKSAHALVKVFADMRGAAMKVGQTLSAVDLGMVPEEIRPEFQEILASLQQSADPVSFKAIEKVIDGRPRRAAVKRVRGLRSRAGRRRVDRPGPPGDAARRPRGRGQGPVPGHRGGDPLRPAEPAPRPQAAERDRARHRHRRHRRPRSASASPRSSTTSSRRPTTARWRARTAAIRSSSCRTSSPSLCRERVIVSEYVDGERFAARARRSRRTSATASARSSPASTSTARCATGCSTATRTRATACSWPTGASRSSTSASSSTCPTPTSASCSAPPARTYDEDPQALLGDRRRARRAAARPGARAAVLRALRGDLRLADGRRAADRGPDADRGHDAPLQLRCAARTASAR